MPKKRGDNEGTPRQCPNGIRRSALLLDIRLMENRIENAYLGLQENVRKNDNKEAKEE